MSAISLPPDRPEGGIVGISDIAQGCIKGLGIRHVELGAQTKPAWEIGVGDEGPPKCDGICRKFFLRATVVASFFRPLNEPLP
jgi:hypothetical protein